MIDSLKEYDKILFLFINSFHHEFFDSIMQMLSGQAIWIPFVGFFIIKSLAFYGRNFTLRFVVFLILIIIASDVTSSYIFKNIFERLRPCREADLIPLIHQFGQRCGGRFGFVSSHSANSFALVFFSTNILFEKKNWHVIIWAMPILVGYSRIYLGVHYPGDVIGGAVIGIFWAYIFSKFYKIPLRSKTV